MSELNGHLHIVFYERARLCIKRQFPKLSYDQEGYEPYETAAYRDEQQMQPHEHPTFPPVTHNKETNEFLNGPGEKCAAFCSHCVETCADAKYQVQTCLEELPVSKSGRSMDEGG